MHQLKKKVSSSITDDLQTQYVIFHISVFYITLLQFVANIKQ